MLRKSISVFVILILFGLVFGPLSTANAQSSNSVLCPPYETALIHDKNFVRSLPPECAKKYQRLTQRQGNESKAIDITSLSIGGPVGGPDAFGYTYDDSVPYNWIAASTNTGVAGDDVISGAVDIGFNFPFYGFSYSQLFFNTNGGITFGGGSYEYGGFVIPDSGIPNNLIALFWEDLLVGSPNNSGAIFYSQGGTAPNRYFILEWRDVTTFEGSLPFSFEAILYENGDIVIQHQSLPSYYYTTVGIENMVGDEGLLYQLYFGGLSIQNAIHFYYPVTPTARVSLSPPTASHFSSAGGTNDFLLTVANTGSMGADTYDLTVYEYSSWAATLYAADGITQLIDTDGDSKVDTGLISQGDALNIIVRVSVPGGAVMGETGDVRVMAGSSLNPFVEKNSVLKNIVAPSFVQVLNDDGMPKLLFTGGIHGEDIYQIGANNTLPRSNPAITSNANGKYLYAWSMGLNQGFPILGEDIEYALVKPDGSLFRTATKLTNNLGAAYRTQEWEISVSAAPNGNMAIVWLRVLENTITYQVNFNVYLSILDGDGNLLSGPTNLTNDSTWSSTLQLKRPTIAATDDNRFVVCWEDAGWDFWYAVYDTTGNTIFSPILLTNDHNNHIPILNSLSNGNVILTYSVITPSPGGIDHYPYYMILKSDGLVVKTETLLGLVSNPHDLVDATLLPNGKIAAAWGTSTGLAYSVLNSVYTREGDPYIATYTPTTPYYDFGYGISVTTDSDSHIIFTWGDHNMYDFTLRYALGDTNGFITSPVEYRRGYTGDLNWNGQGNAPYIQLAPPTVSSIAKAGVDPSSDTTITFTVTFSETVTGVDTGDFSLTTSGVSGAAVSGVSGSGSVYTVTVNTGSGSGTIHLNVVDNDSILNVSSTPLGGAGPGNGDFTTGETYTITKTWIFGDVPNTYWANSFIERLYNAGVTGGCSTIPLNYCPESTVTRAQMAVFLLKGMHGSSYSPPPVGASTGFADVATDYWAAAWIKQLFAEGITSGCLALPLSYCPEATVTRSQMSVFLLKAKHGITYSPPPATGVFTDVPAGYWARNWIEQLAAEGITSGCGAGVYCPEDLATRAQMAIFLVKTFNLP